MNTRPFLLFLFLWSTTFLGGQVINEGFDYPPYPEERYEKVRELKFLPSRVDNSISRSFPPIFKQYGASCNQASSIGYMLTYELCRVREVDASLPENQCSPSFAWNFLNSGNDQGVSYFDTWKIVKDCGCPSNVDFPYFDNRQKWMSGFEKYLRSLRNSISNNYSIYVGDDDGLLKLKKYLFDHNDYISGGGVGSIQISSGGQFSSFLRDSLGAAIIDRLGVYVGHSLTVVGYDDHVQYDFNRDGMCTNNLDINDDGEVTLADREIGGLIIVNSYGEKWGDMGRAYLPYRLLSRYGYEGGIWNKTVHVIDVQDKYEPSYMLKLRLAHQHRNQLKLHLGCSTDMNAKYPEHVFACPIVNYNGGNLGLNIDDDDATLELGIDISQVFNYQLANKPLKVFILIDELDPFGTGKGSLFDYGVYSFLENDTIINMISGEFPLLDNQTSTFVIKIDGLQKSAKVFDYETQYIDADKWADIPLYANGLSYGIHWEVFHDYKHDTIIEPFPSIVGDFNPLYTTSDDDTLKIELPFEFPFFGESYTELFATKRGELFLDQIIPRKYPYARDQELIISQRKCIMPLRQELVFVSPDGGIYTELTDSIAKIFYRCDIHIGHYSRKYEFGCYLFPNGKIEFHYSDINLDTPERIIGFCGLSPGGGGELVETKSSVIKMITPNMRCRMTPYEMPLKTSIVNNSYILTRPEKENYSYVIPVKVSDNEHHVAIGYIPISTSGLSDNLSQVHVYPNPFSESAMISFIVPEEGQVKMDVFSIDGKLVRCLIDHKYDKGKHEILWDGKSSMGESLASGVYIARIVTGDEQQQVKILKNAW